MIEWPSVVVMGVSGCGKSTLGLALAARLQRKFYDADDFHPPENVARMAQGIALTDADRAPWLDRLAALLAEGPPVVLACSALRRSYRDRLRGSGAALRFVFLTAPDGVIAARLAARQGHYMPAGLLASQLATLEVPDADEAVLTLDCRDSMEQLLAHIEEAWFGAAAGA
ncbi:MAG TPA: gluconokinase [Xanthobacteraceae bacterium]|nr:gluconokinase [Xanthobacteraceae bacterium]